MIAPPLGTIERWCFDFVTTDELARKLAPCETPDTTRDESFEAARGDGGVIVAPPARRLTAPGRPASLRVVARSPSAPRPEALVDVAARGRLLHTFLHHELQAAELFAWAVLAFPATPRAFRVGLVKLCREELAHLALYRGHMRELGVEYGDHPVRDWFWQRVTRCTTPESFVALQGLGLEGANLEHSARYAAHARAIGDDALARTFEVVERDEIGHVAFAVHWFERFTGAPLDYDRFRAALPHPLTPAVLQGKPLNRVARGRAGLDTAFLDRLESEPPTSVPRDDA